MAVFWTDAEPPRGREKFNPMGWEMMPENWTCTGQPKKGWIGLERRFDEKTGKPPAHTPK
jgi:hypothetical protein